ncbi:MAG: DUF4387 family protein [Marinibacterium sp.]
MAELGDMVEKVRSKNAGPFWITIDIFCGTPERFCWLRDTVPSDRVAVLYGIDPDALKRFEIPNLNAVKFSFPRPVPQGSPEDRDQHGAQYAVLLQELEVKTTAPEA